MPGATLAMLVPPSPARVRVDLSSSSYFTAPARPASTFSSAALNWPRLTASVSCVPAATLVTCRSLPALPTETLSTRSATEPRSEEHTSELQVTNAHLVCRLLLEKQKHKTN